jgi:ParB-like chromosome segregation protein Spo0J
MRTVTEADVELGRLGERHGVLRLRLPEAERVLAESLRRHGQLSAVVAVREAGALELVDGFKRLAAARGLGWTRLHVRAVDLDSAAAKAAVLVLNRASGLSELEQGFVVRSLYRDNGLTQPQIGALLSRNKSWVCRRLALVEQLDEAVAADVRLGLLAARTAVAVARLPHGNQRDAAHVVGRRGLTTAQTERFVSELLAVDAAHRAQLVEAWSTGAAGPVVTRRTAPAGPGPRLVADIERLRQAATRLSARLLERPLGAFGPELATTVLGQLVELEAALGPLVRAVQQCRGAQIPSPPIEEKSP